MCSSPCNSCVILIICDILLLQMIQLHQRSGHGRRRFTRRSFWPCKGVNLSWRFISFSAFFLLSPVYVFSLNCSHLETIFSKYHILIPLKATIFRPDSNILVFWVFFEWQRWFEPFRMFVPTFHSPPLACRSCSVFVASSVTRWESCQSPLLWL